LYTLHGSSISFGHQNGYAVSPVTSSVAGLVLNSYSYSGLIGDMYDIYIATHTGSGLVSRRYGIYQTSTGRNYFAGVVGIGAVPADSTVPLTVSTAGMYAANFIKPSMTANDKFRILIGTSDADNQAFSIGYIHNTTSSDRKLFIGTRESWNLGTNIEGITVNGDGNVGIGGSPSYRLSVVQTANSYAYGIGVVNTTQTGRSSIWNDSSNNFRIDCNTTSDATGNILLNGGGTGFVGIGTTSAPGAKLDVWNGSIFLSNSNVNHGMTSQAPTNTYGLFQTVHPGAGGLLIAAMSDDNINPFALYAIIGSSDPTDTTPAISLIGAKKSGTSLQSLDSGETVFQLSNYISNNIVTALGSGYVGFGVDTPSEKVDIRDGNLALSNASVAHGMTSIAGTNVYGKLNPISPFFGGLDIQGLSDDDYPALRLSATIGSDDPNNTYPAVVINGAKKDGTTYQALADTETVLTVSNFAAGLFYIKGNGNIGIGVASPGSKLAIADLPVYADNAAAQAGGLLPGDFYQTSTGVVMVRYVMSSVSPSISPSPSPSVSPSVSLSPSPSPSVSPSISPSVSPSPSLSPSISPSISPSVSPSVSVSPSKSPSVSPSVSVSPSKSPSVSPSV